MSTDYSRTMHLATYTTDEAPTELEARIHTTHVLVSVDQDEPAAVCTMEVLIANLRRLPVQLWLDPHGGRTPLRPEVLERMESLTAGIDPDRPLRLGRPSATTHVHVGTGATAAAVSGAADGHGTRIRPHGVPFPALSVPGTALGRRCSTTCSEGRGALLAVVGGVGGLVAGAPIGLS